MRENEKDRCRVDEVANPTEVATDGDGVAE